MKTTIEIWPVTILVSSLTVAAATLANTDTPIRSLIALWFLLICPGMAWIRLFRMTDSLTELTLAIALSLALDALVATAMLYVGIWSPQKTLIILIYISIAGAWIQIWSISRQIRTRPKQVYMNPDSELR